MAQLVKVHEPRSPSECEAQRLLAELLPSSWIITTNLKEYMFPGRHRPEIDSVLLTPLGIFVLDFKDFRGAVTPMMNEHWGDLDKAEKKKNPLEQIFDNIYPVKDLLKGHDKSLTGIRIEPLIVLSNAEVQLDWTGSDVNSRSRANIATLVEVEAKVRALGAAGRTTSLDATLASKALGAFKPKSVLDGLFADAEWSQREAQTSSVTQSAEGTEARKKQSASTATYGSQQTSGADPPRRNREYSQAEAPAESPPRNTAPPQMKFQKAVSSEPKNDPNFVFLSHETAQRSDVSDDKGSAASILKVVGILGAVAVVGSIIFANAPPTNTPTNSNSPIESRPVAVQSPCADRNQHDVAIRGSVDDLKSYVRQCRPVGGNLYEDAANSLASRLYSQSSECMASTCDFDRCLSIYTDFFGSGSNLSNLQSRRQGVLNRCRPAAPEPRQVFEATLREFRLFGVFAFDCAQGPSQTNTYRQFGMQGGDLVLVESGPLTDFGTNQKTFKITKVEKVDSNRVGVTVLTPPVYVYNQYIELVVDRDHFRSWRVTFNGSKVMIDGGVVSSNRQPTRWFTRCR